MAPSPLPLTLAQDSFFDELFPLNEAKALAYLAEAGRSKSYNNAPYFNPPPQAVRKWIERDPAAALRLAEGMDFARLKNNFRKVAFAALWSKDQSAAMRWIEGQSWDQRRGLFLQPLEKIAPQQAVSLLNTLPPPASDASIREGNAYRSSVMGLVRSLFEKDRTAALTWMRQQPDATSHRTEIIAGTIIPTIHELPVAEAPNGSAISRPTPTR